MFKVKKQTASMFTRDGVCLDADVYLPEAAGDFPVLLMRQPYGRKIASTVVYAHPSWYAAHGYIVVIQDVRGRGTSQGDFHLFTSETTDGVDAIAWAAQLPQSNGNVGMYGFSYQAMTQLYAASEHPPALKTICPAMMGYDLYSDWAYEGGAFCLQANLSWAIQLATETAKLLNDEIAYRTLFAASRHLPVEELDGRLEESLRKYAPDGFYHQWLDHPQLDHYWRSLSPDLSGVDLPMLHIGGWFDPFLRGNIRLYREMTSRSSSPQHLIIGPWAHIPWGRKVGALDYGTAAASPVDQIQLHWFDQFLKGQDTGRLEMPPVLLFEMGSNRWRSLDTFPHDPGKSFFLSTTGLASIGDKEGILGETLTDTTNQDTFVHDPWRPVPALGGHASTPAGAFDRSSIDCRTDVLTYTSEPLGEDLYLTGEITVELYATADTPSFDLCAILSEVRPDGQVFNFAQGYCRVDQLQSPIVISLQPTCICITKGKAIRLSVSTACFPAYAVNPGTGATTGKFRKMDAQIITITVACGGNSPSHVKLPVASSA